MAAQPKANIAYLNGQFLPIEEARVSAMDRGFLFGDGVYEVIPLFNGHLFRYAQHIERFKRSLQAIGLNVAIEEIFSYATAKELIDRNGDGEQTLYLQVTRGASMERNLLYPTTINPTIFAFCAPLAVKTIEELAKGCIAITLPDVRWQCCNIKAITLLGNALLRNEAAAQGADEAILIRDGKALEGTSSNFFMVKHGTLLTPPLSNTLLGGITRELILELAEQHQLPYDEREILAEELSTADELWVCASGKEIVPIVQLNGKPVGLGKAGPVWYTMIQYYQAYKRDYSQCPTSHTPESLLTFPCEFCIKVVGEDVPDFEIAVLAILHKHVPNLTEGCIRSRLSKKNKYLAMTVTIQAQSKQQLDAIYLDFSDCEHILMAL